jgi:hypothetical protein
LDAAQRRGGGDGPTGTRSGTRTRIGTRTGTRIGIRIGIRIRTGGGNRSATRRYVAGA